MSTSTSEPRTPGNAEVLVCTCDHVAEVAWWATRRPTVCPFAPCSRRFLTPAQRAARTRATNARLAELAAWEASRSPLAANRPSISADHPAVRALDAGARWDNDMLVEA